MQATTEPIEIKLENGHHGLSNLQIDEIMMLRQCGGTYKAISEITGVKIAAIRRICTSEGI